MSAGSTGSSSIQRVSPSIAAATAGNAPTSGTRPTTTVVATAEAPQAAVGAQLVQQPVAEAFNAPMLRLPENATTRHVLDGLARAMADPSVNKTTAQRLFQFHQQLFEMDKAMTQVILQGVSDGRAG